jgi:hypothetical protein
MRILHIFADIKLERPWGSMRALSTSTTASTPFPPSDGFAIGKFKKGVEETVHHLLDEAGWDLVIEGVKSEAGG